MGWSLQTVMSGHAMPHPVPLLPQAPFNETNKQTTTKRKPCTFLQKGISKIKIIKSLPLDIKTTEMLFCIISCVSVHLCNECIIIFI